MKKGMASGMIARQPVLTGPTPVSAGRPIFLWDRKSAQAMISAEIRHRLNMITGELYHAYGCRASIMCQGLDSHRYGAVG